MARGKYIVIEGHDGTGKSTQVKALADYLKHQGIDSFIPEEPAGTPIADAIRTVIKNGDLERDAETNVLLFTAARHEIWQRAKQELEQGRWVLSARNFLSTEAYQGYGEGLDLAMIRDVTSTFTDDQYMHPDHTIILTLDDSDERKKRISMRGTIENPDTFEMRTDDFQAKVNAGYLTIASENNFPIIDARRSVDDIQGEIRKLIALPE